MKVKITQLEMQLLEDIAYTDHSSDGMGFSCWVSEHWFSLPMRQVRALISTLVQKEVIFFEPEGYGLPACIWPRPNFMVETDEGENRWVRGNPFVEGRYGFRYVNLILPKKKRGESE
tara:strand:- start:3324 stop:3674 length:351 start_codon:yes stop_codon:yes gene_type:complete